MRSGQYFVHGVVVFGFALGAVGKIEMAGGVPDPRRWAYLGECATEVHPFADHAQVVGRFGIDCYLALLRRFAIVEARVDRGHNPKSNPSSSPASSPVALTCSSSVATKPSIPLAGRSDRPCNW